MSEELSEILRIRREKLNILHEKNINPYPYKFERTHYAADIVSKPEEFENTTKTVRIAGRIMSWRGHGKTLFAHVKDSSGQIQIYVRLDDIGQLEFDRFSMFDIGDIIGVQGSIFKTRTGEVTVRVASFELLSKSLRPLPEKWHGLQDKELRYRRRYLDLISNPEVTEIFVKRTRIVNFLKRFLDEKGFLEVETPTLQILYGGATARPFVTHLNALDLDLYLRIADELYLKRAIIGGMEKVYEIAKDFRNEGMDRSHSPEFTMLEFYWAYTDYFDMMELVEQMFYDLALEINKTPEVTFDDNIYNLKPPFPRLPMMKTLTEILGKDILDASELELKSLAQARGLSLEGIVGKAGYFDLFSKKLLEPKLVQPTFLIDYPIELSPLAKRHRSDPRLTERFEFFIGGVEYGNGFSELNDPIDQRQRFEAQMSRMKQGDQEAHPIDEDFIFALEHGMPPTSGYGVGVDRIVMLLTNSHSIRDVILFPIMKPEVTGPDSEAEE